jgi:DNA repair exonuclease SbcCD ATPase subunit
VQINLVSLEIEGFRSFRQYTKIDFPKNDSLVLISGKWKDTDVSSGSGKSSILEAIAFCLDISTASATSLKNWDSKKMLVKLTLSKGDDIIQITRDPKLSISVNGVPYEGLVKGSKERLQELLGVNPDMLKTMTYRKQRVAGKIIRSTDSQIKEFLTQTLGLDEIENFIEENSKLINTTSRSLDIIRANYESATKNLSSSNISDEEIQSLKNGVIEAESTFEKYKDDTANKNLTTEINNLTIEYKKSIEIKNNVEKAKYSNDNIKKTIINLINEIEHLSKSSCPTCLRDWQESKQLLDIKTKEKDALILKFQDNLSYIKDSESVISNYSKLEYKINELNKQLAMISAPKNMAYQSLLNAKSALSMGMSKRNSYIELTNRVSELFNEGRIKQQELEVLESTNKLLGRTGFLGNIFDEILADIQIRTNDMLSNFPNASQFTVQISSTKEVKSKGTTKKEISITINNNGNEIGIDDLSGGQQSAIELCSDLAAAEVIRARSGCGLGWICLDEVMDGLGAVEKEAAVNMIRQRVKGLVLMIEHSTEIKESFNEVIEIEFSGKESRLTITNNVVY